MHIRREMIFMPFFSYYDTRTMYNFPHLLHFYDQLISTTNFIHCKLMINCDNNKNNVSKKKSCFRAYELLLSFPLGANAYYLLHLISLFFVSRATTPCTTTNNHSEPPGLICNILGVLFCKKMTFSLCFRPAKLWSFYRSSVLFCLFTCWLILWMFVTSFLCLFNAPFMMLCYAIESEFAFLFPYVIWICLTA